MAPEKLAMSESEVSWNKHSSSVNEETTERYTNQITPKLIHTMKNANK